MVCQASQVGTIQQEQPLEEERGARGTEKWNDMLKSSRVGMSPSIKLGG